MNTQRLIREMEADIQSAEEKGVKEIQIKNFKAYLDEIKEIVKEQEEKDVLQTQRDLAFYNAKHASRLEKYRARINRISDGFNAVIAIGQGALKSGALINGGACVAILAFIGNIITKDSSMIHGLSVALLSFGFGVFFAAVASGTTYLAQACYESKKTIKVAVWINNLTIFIVILSYVSFLCGGLQSYLTMKNWKQEESVSMKSQVEVITSRPKNEDINTNNAN